MRLILLINILSTIALLELSAQNAPKTLGHDLQAKPHLTLQMPGESGTNGAGVAYNPPKKIYCAAFAGNSTFPLAVFDSGGKRLSDDKLFCLYDARSIWYNTQKKRWEGNAYGGSVVEIQSNDKGIPVGTSLIFNAEKAANYTLHEQMAGAFDTQKKRILYSWITEIAVYDSKKGKEQTVVKLPLTEDQIEDFNATGLVYTGFKGGEIGLLNVKFGQVWLFDITSGKHSATIQLPEDAPLNPAFNFSFSNNLIWLFDTDNRIWTGYSIH